MRTIRYRSCVCLLTASALGWAVEGCRDDGARAGTGAATSAGGHGVEAPDPEHGLVPDPHEGHGHSGGPARPEVDSHESGGPAQASIPTAPVPADEWCFEHGVPESLCTKCKPALVAQFKERGDWCEGHDRPESQCLECNPGLKARWAAVRPATAPAEPSAGGVAASVERPLGRPTNANDPLCPVDQRPIRLAGPDVARKAGISTEPVQRRRLSASIECPGEIQYDQTRLAHISPPVKGLIRETKVDLGAAIKAGDVLAVIESPTLGEAKSRYIERRENYALAKADLERTQAVSAATRRMLEVCTTQASADDVRRELSDVRVGEAKSRLLKAHAALELARQSLERKTRLRQEQIGSEQDYQTAQSSFNAAEADFQATRETIVFADERGRLTAEQSATVARSALEAAERQLLIMGLDADEVRALAAGANQVLSHYELRSPVAGHVVQLHSVVGEAMTEEDTICTVADLASMWAMLHVQERDLVELRVGLPVLFMLEGLRGHALPGRTAWVSSEVDERTRTVAVRAVVPNDQGILRANMFGTARIILHEADELLTVPAEAVQTDGCCQLVFVQKDEAVFEPRKVVLGSTVGGYVHVLRGLDAGEPVVTIGSFLMKTEVLKGNIGAGCCEVDPGR